jgi:hypothetical protein
MASTVTSDSYVYARRETVHSYKWPGVALNVWILVMLASALTIMGVFSVFIQIQQQMLLPVPWYVHSIFLPSLEALEYLKKRKEEKKRCDINNLCYLQVLPVLHNRERISRLVRRPHFMARFPTTPPPGDSHDRCLFVIYTLACRLNSGVDRALGSFRLCE